MLSSASTLFFGFDKGCSVYFGPAANLYEIFGATGRSHSSKYVIVTVFIVGINHNRDGSLGNLEDLEEIDKGGTESSESQRASTASATRPAILAPALSLTDTYVSTGAASTAASAPAAPSSPASESSISHPEMDIDRYAKQTPDFTMFMRKLESAKHGGQKMSGMSPMLLIDAMPLVSSKLSLNSLLNAELTGPAARECAYRTIRHAYGQLADQSLAR